MTYFIFKLKTFLYLHKHLKLTFLQARKTIKFTRQSAPWTNKLAVEVRFTYNNRILYLEYYRGTYILLRWNRQSWNFNVLNTAENIKDCCDYLWEF